VCEDGTSKLPLPDADERGELPDFTETTEPIQSGFSAQTRLFSAFIRVEQWQL
jgi:hypothetical protein